MRVASRDFKRDAVRGRPHHPRWHDERHKGTRPIHAATGAPSNFSGLLDYVVGAGGCGVDIVGLSVDGT